MLYDRCSSWAKYMIEFLIKFFFLIYTYKMVVQVVPSDWLESYLTRREQIVHVEHYDHQNKAIANIASPKQRLERSIQRGSILTRVIPILHNLH